MSFFYLQFSLYLSQFKHQFVLYNSINGMILSPTLFEAEEDKIKLLYISK